MLDIEKEKSVDVPLRVDSTGSVCVGDTRVTLLSVLTSFQGGETPEQILHSFPGLRLSDVYAVITYYLTNRNTVDTWLDAERTEGARIQKETEARFPQAGIRDRLLQRKAAQHRESP